MLLVLATPTSVHRAQTVPLESSWKKKVVVVIITQNECFYRSSRRPREPQINPFNLRVHLRRCYSIFYLDFHQVYDPLNLCLHVLSLHKAAIFCLKSLVFVISSPSHMVHCFILAGNCSDVSVSLLPCESRHQRTFPSRQICIFKKRCN